MTERVIFPNINSIRYTPFGKTHIGELELLDGSIQLNFRYRDEGVLHITPEFCDLSLAEALICNKWLYLQKAFLLANTHKLASSLHPRIVAPEVLKLGKLSQANNAFWYDKFELGNKLSNQVFTGVDIGIYSDLIIWLARFHESQTKGESLREYYFDRLQAFEEIFKSPSFQTIIPESNKLLRLVERFKDEIASLIEGNEVASIIHGDLHGGNILVAEEKIVVLDFEQGIKGGDWFSDISKLLNPDSTSLPDPERRYRYRAPINTSQKRGIFAMYMRERTQHDWITPNFLMMYINTGDVNYVRRRTELSTLDNMLSVLVLRYLSNWNFYINQASDRKGIHFIMELIDGRFGKYYQ